MTTDEIIVTYTSTDLEGHTNHLTSSLMPYFTSGGKLNKFNFKRGMIVAFKEGPPPRAFVFRSTATGWIQPVGASLEEAQIVAKAIAAVLFAITPRDPIEFSIRPHRVDRVDEVLKGYIIEGGYLIDVEN